MTEKAEDTEKTEKTELLPREEVEEAAGRCRLVLDAVNQVILGKPHLARLLFAAVLHLCCRQAAGLVGAKGGERLRSCLVVELNQGATPERTEYRIG